MRYPRSRMVNQIDDYHGTRVPDPYRWLEDDKSAATRAWVASQNKLTLGYLDSLPFRQQLRRRLEEVQRFTRYSTPIRAGRYTLFGKNDGLQSQSVVYIQENEHGQAEPLIDPNCLSPNGIAHLTCVAPSHDARYLAYGLAVGGGDWEEYFVKELATRRDLPDRLRWVLVGEIAWSGDGFFYSRYPEPHKAAPTSARREFHQVWYHQVGTPQSADKLIYEDAAHPLRFHWVKTTEDERFAVLSISDRGAGKDGNAMYVLQLQCGISRLTLMPIATGFDDLFLLVDNDGDKLLVLTNRGAPNRRVVAIDPADPDEAHWTAVVPETSEYLESVSAAGDSLFAVYSRRGAHSVRVAGRDGTMCDEIRLPNLGSASGFRGNRSDRHVYWRFSSFTFPPALYRYDLRKRASVLVHRSSAPVSPSDYTTKLVTYPSKDGTLVPMYIVARQSLELNGQNPTMVLGYGGFGVPVVPSFNPLLIPLLERGVVIAMPGVRGGGEYGEEWHHAGWREHKQNGIDDFIAAVEWLQHNGYTSRRKCAVYGRSNGGLLVGAVMTQRPELCSVVLLAQGVLDMLRFQHFTIGWNWAAEYGSSQDPRMFPYLVGYSPLHNIKNGVGYPATLITASEHDDRVAPGHQFKFTATLQSKGCGPNPYLIRIASGAAHGAVSTRLRIDEVADAYAFMLAHLR